MHGVSILVSRVAEAAIERYGLSGRLVSRGGECKELHFHYREPKPMLPVIIGGKIVVCEWGNWSELSALPRAAWIGQESIEAGKCRWMEPQQVEIPADFGFDKGVWYQITQGIRGVLVHDGHEKPHVYILTVPASHYYRIMTRAVRMPVLIEQEI